MAAMTHEHYEPIVNLNVGGVRFTTALKTLCRFPDTMFGRGFSGTHHLPRSEDGSFFIDRDGTHFRHILNFLRSPDSFKMEVRGAEARELRRECKYYGIDQLMFTGTQKRLVYMYGATGSVPAKGSLAVLVDVNGVHTIRDCGEEVIHCTSCNRGLFNFGGNACYFQEFHKQSTSEGQPKLHGTCPFCNQHC
jgi:hypothetical protein